jgi:hypothetical protein
MLIGLPVAGGSSCSQQSSTQNHVPSNRRRPPLRLPSSAPFFSSSHTELASLLATEFALCLPPGAGKLMFSNVIIPSGTCTPVLYSRAVGLPVTACSEADRKARLQRQAQRQQVRQRQAAASKAGQAAQSQVRPSLDTSLQAIMSGQGSSLPGGGGRGGDSQQQQAAALVGSSRGTGPGRGRKLMAAGAAAAE